MRDRDTYIGGSSASVIMCDNDYESLRALYDRMRGDFASKDISANPHVRRGVYLEPFLEKWIFENLDDTINIDAVYREYDAGGGHGGQIFLEHPEYDWIGGHPDGIGWNHPKHADETVLYEIKAPTPTGVQKIERSGLPARYTFQVQHYMMCAGIKHSYVVVMDYTMWRGWPIYVPAKPELQQSMLDAYKDFKFSVDMGFEPEMASDEYKEHMNLTENVELDTTLAAYNAAKEQQYEGKNARARLKGEILSLVGDQNKVTTDNHILTIKRNYGRYDSTMVKVSER